MASLFHSGNLAGFVGLSLVIWVGLQLVRSGQRGGWLLALGAGSIAFSVVYRLYLEPLLVKPIHLTFSHGMITLATATPTISLTLGFILIPLGLFMVAAHQQKQRPLARARS